VYLHPCFVKSISVSGKGCSKRCLDHALFLCEVFDSIAKKCSEEKHLFHSDSNISNWGYITSVFGAVFLGSDGSLRKNILIMFVNTKFIGKNS
jgi:hypothetical protein